MKRTKTTTGILLVIVLTLGIFTGIGAISAPVEPEYAPGEVIIGLEKINTAATEAITSKGGNIVKEIPALNALVVKVPAGNEKAFIKGARGIPGLRYAERNGIYKAVEVRGQYTPSDPDWNLQYNMRIIDADDAWDIEMGSTGVVIAIVDTGIDYNHADLSAHYVPGGYDWVNTDPDPWDDHFHGTHCAGIAAAVMDNGWGVTGVSQSSVLAEKVLDHTGGGYWDWIANGIIHATNLGVDIISMSLGGTGYSQLVNDACAYAYGNGVLLVAAAGNDNMDIGVIPFYPACYETVMAISGTDSNDQKYYWSNYGTPIEVSAPGVDVWSTMPGNSYAYKTGTSMSTPHVAGVAALVWSDDPSYTNVEMRTHLQEAVDDLGTPGWDPIFGYGRTNAYQALSGGPVFEYSFRLNPFVDVVHINIDMPDMWLYGINEASYSVPILGKAESGRAYWACDLPAGGIEMYFVEINIATRDGYMYRINDDMSIIGPDYVWLTLVAGEAEGVSADEASGAEASPQTMHTFQMNPFIDLCYVYDDIRPWLYGYQDVVGSPAYPAPLLGYARGSSFFWGTDFVDGHGGYELLFMAGSIPTRDGYIIRTTDGYSYDGPTYVWLTTAGFGETYKGALAEID